MFVGRGSALWTKEYIEHIRATHFTLITLCLGLVILTQSYRPYSASKALSQLDDLMSVSTKWSPKELLWNGGGHDAPHGSDVGATTINEGEAPSAHFACSYNVPNQPTKTFRCQVSNIFFELESSEAAEPIPPPHTIAGFQQWLKRYDRGVRTAELGAVKGGSAYDTALGPTKLVTANDDNSINHAATIPLTLSGSERDSTFSFMLAGVNQDVGVQAQITVTQWREGKLTRNTLRYAKILECTLPFAECFPDLTAAAQGMEGLSFDEIRSRLTSQLNQGKEVFEAFGIQIPIDSLILWGSVLILSVQAYLYVQLREMAPGALQTSTSWEAPWIALFPSSIAKCAVFATFVLLPPTAVIALALTRSAATRELADPAALYENFMQLLKIRGAMPTLLSLLIGSLSWGCRPLVGTAASAVNNKANAAAG